MFKHRKHHSVPAPASADRPTASAEDLPPVPAAPPPAESVGQPRTTCYPQDAEAPPPRLGQPKTTVYRQAVRWTRRGYDTIN